MRKKCYFLILMVYAFAQANYAQEAETFFAIHCEPQNPHLFPRLIELVDKANYVINWFEFVQNTQRKTARQIMRDRDCTPTATDVAFDDGPVPTSLQLAHNYPNPFNPQTAISYTIPPPHAGIPFVQLKIYNLRGRLVRTLVSEFHKAGGYTVTWDGLDYAGREVTSGVFLPAAGGFAGADAPDGATRLILANRQTKQTA
jgi:hypothetical protein